jgi:hypothetical protein
MSMMIQLAITGFPFLSFPFISTCRRCCCSCQIPACFVITIFHTASYEKKNPRLTELLQSERSMISAPAGITLDGATRAAVRGTAVGRAAGGVGFAAASKGGVAAWKLQVAALRARMMAGDVASPGTRAVGVDGVPGFIGERDVVAKEVALLDVGIV